jgi:hypothetical protein
MAKLPKYTLIHREDKDDWALKQDKTDRTVKRFDTKEEATKRGVLKQTIGPEGGSVKIQKQDGDYQEERTFPRSKDPRKSPG